MEIRDLIQGVFRETIHFPVLFGPIFVTSFLNGILASDAAIASMGPGGSLVLRLLILVLLTPLSAGITVMLDRRINSQVEPDLLDSFADVRAKYFPLIIINFVALVATVLGLFLFIVPGVYLYVKFVFTTQEVLLGDETDLTSALEKSWNHTTNRWGTIFGIILIFEIPLLFFSFSLAGLPPGWGATLSVVVGTAFQTWLTLVVTHLYLQILQKGEQNY